MLIELIHHAGSWLLEPVLFTLLLSALIATGDLGLLVGELLGGLKRLSKSNSVEAVERLARQRIERADILARISPMLGLMGTLIPLGPGLAALGRGDVAVLAQAVTIAFDTTVLGLFAGIIAFVTSRLRRRWYDQLLNEMEEKIETHA